MKNQNICLADISQEKTLRQDYKFLDYRGSLDRDNYQFDELFEILQSEEIDAGELYEDFKYCEIGNTSKYGDLNPVILNFSSRNLLDEDYYKKIEKGDILIAEENDILISKVRPNLKKYIRITKDIKDIYFTAAFIRLRAKIMPEIMYYCLRTVFYPNINAISRRGKSYPTLSENDLRTLKFDKQIVNTLYENRCAITKEVLQNEKKIEILKDKIRPIEDIINQAFIEFFSLNLDSLNTINEQKDCNTTAANIADRNSNVRFSYRWTKGKRIQDCLISSIKCCQALGNFLIATQNGWSPECYDSESDYQVLGIDAITKVGRISFDYVKYSNIPKNNFDNYIVKDGDFFVSRGNTTELVALASIAKVDEDDPITIFPDLMIRLTLSDEINKKYLAYVINSFIGRLYFKYVTKGKNQSMVKVSPKELKEFMLPVPSMEEQREIVQIIDTKIEEQRRYEEQIADLRISIEKLVTEKANLSNKK